MKEEMTGKEVQQVEQQIPKKKKGRKPNSKVLTINTKKGRIIIYKFLSEVIRNSNFDVRRLSTEELEIVKKLIQDKHAMITSDKRLIITSSGLLHLLKLDLSKGKVRVGEQEKERLLRDIIELSKDVADEDVKYENEIETIQSSFFEIGDEEEDDYSLDEGEAEDYDFNK